MVEHRLRDHTERLILEAVASSGRPLTRTQIARVLNRKKTPHLIALLDDMVQQGQLVQAVTTFHNGVQGYVYSIPFEGGNP